MSEFRNLTRNILRQFRASSPAHIEAGLDWYPMTYTHCERIGAYTGWSATRSVVALSHLSPRTKWEDNIKGLEALLSGAEKPGRILTRSWARAYRSLLADDPLATFSKEALKTGSFARAILGDLNAVTVDVWAARVAGVGESMIRSTHGYHAVAESYRRGAKIARISPRELQAITWVSIRSPAA